MTHVSQKRVKRKTAKLLEERFVRFILGLKNSKQGELLLKEILTPTERTMLAKRVSIIYMLERGYSFYRIQKILKVSTSTILRFWKQKQSGAFVHTLQSFKKVKNGFHFAIGDYNGDGNFDFIFTPTENSSPLKITSLGGTFVTEKFPFGGSDYGHVFSLFRKN